MIESPYSQDLRQKVIGYLESRNGYDEAFKYLKLLNLINYIRLFLVALKCLTQPKALCQQKLSALLLDKSSIVKSFV